MQFSCATPKRETKTRKRKCLFHMAIFTWCTICLYFYSFWQTASFHYGFCCFHIQPLCSNELKSWKVWQVNMFLLFKTGEGEGHTYTSGFRTVFFSFNTHIDCTIQASLYSEIQQRLNFAPCSGMASLAWKNEHDEENHTLRNSLTLGQKETLHSYFEVVGWFSHQGKQILGFNSHSLSL